MRHDEIEVRVERQGDALPQSANNASASNMSAGSMSSGSMSGESSIGELFKRLTTDMSDLIRQEAELAKVEMRQVGSRLAGDVAKIGVAAGLSLVGALALGTFVILALGNLLGGAYWLSALIVGLVMLAIGAVMARSATNDIKNRGVKPEQTIETLRADKAWASRQARELKHDLTTDPTTGPTAPPPTSR